MSLRKIKYIHNYLISGLNIKDSALNAGYSRSYSKKINSYERWANLASRIMQVEVNEYMCIYREVKDIQRYCEYYKEEISRGM